MTAVTESLTILLECMYTEWQYKKCATQVASRLTRTQLSLSVTKTSLACIRTVTHARQPSKSKNFHSKFQTVCEGCNFNYALPVTSVENFLPGAYALFATILFNRKNKPHYLSNWALRCVIFKLRRTSPISSAWLIYGFKNISAEFRTGDVKTTMLKRDWGQN